MILEGVLAVGRQWATAFAQSPAVIEVQMTVLSFISQFGLMLTLSLALGLALVRRRGRRLA